MLTTFNINNEAPISKYILLKLDADLAKQTHKNHMRT